MVIAAEGEEAKRISIFGSTGSIGKNTLKLITSVEMPFYVEALVAHSNVKLLAEQAISVKAKRAVIADDTRYEELRALLAGTSVIAEAGPHAVLEAASYPCDIFMAAIMGASGLAPTLRAMEQGATIALANKECLVCAGDLLIKEAEKHHSRIIPVDSEHSAIFQILERSPHMNAVEKLYITASGGPFRNFTREQMQHVTPEQAKSHPNWQMGAKISIDSATMMNKGLELIEAYHLFPVEAEQLDVLLHPESIVHGLVSFVDGSVLAQMGTPDMCTPIAVALAWPDRIAAPIPPLNLIEVGHLTFGAVDTYRFPALQLARSALKQGGTAPTILNAANEIAVEGFVLEEIGFLDIVAVVEETLQQMDFTQAKTLEEILQADRQARQIAKQAVSRFKVKHMV